MRPEFRFSLLDFVPPSAVFPIYLLLLAALVLVTVGLWTRVALLVSVLLLFSFNEYGLITLDGGDTLLRLLGFLLLISPCHKAMSMDNLRRRFAMASATGKDQAPVERTMPIWPYQLLLWQMTLLYLASTLHKFGGQTWTGGSAIAIALHHPHFSRLSPMLADWLTILSPVESWFVLLSQLGWILLILVPLLAWLGVPCCKNMRTGSLKRALLLAGALVHIGIAVMMDVGMFSFAVLTAYAGLLIDNDFRAIRGAFNHTFRNQKILVLYDGRCGFCRKSVLMLSMLDMLHRLEFVNIYDQANREKIAPRISLKMLEQAMHVKMQTGEFFKGFSAFRALSWHLPPLWLIAPLLYVPGVRAIGDLVYAWVAEHRR